MYSNSVVIPGNGKSGTVASGVAHAVNGKANAEITDNFTNNLFFIYSPTVMVA